MEERQDLIKKIQTYLKENNKDGLLIHEVDSVEPYFEMLVGGDSSVPAILYIPAEEKPTCLISDLEYDGVISAGVLEKESVIKYEQTFLLEAKKLIDPLKGKTILINYSESDAPIDQMSHSFVNDYLEGVNIESSEKLWNKLGVKPEVKEYIFNTKKKVKKQRVKELKSKFRKSFNKGYLMINGVGIKASQTLTSYLVGFSKNNKYAIAIKPGKAVAIVHKSERLRGHPFDKIYKYNDSSEFKKIISDFFQDVDIVHFDKEMTEGNYQVLKNTLEDKLATTEIDLIRETFSARIPDEIKEIEKGCKINTEIFEYLETILKKGISEKEIVELVERRALGYSEVLELSFNPLIAAGSNGVKVHHFSEQSDYKIQEDDLLLVDIGVRLKSGMCSDTTCMFYFGEKVPRRIKKYDKIMDKSIKAALKNIGPGKSKMDADSAARNIIEKHYPKTYLHVTGHSIDIQVHGIGRAITVIPTGFFGVGQTFSLEPGIYIRAENLSKKFPKVEGFRKEILISITEDGVKQLSEIPKLRIIKG
ncbi:MAG: M24 family metallopeptidase [Nanoarchaeota archaeon]|nr:M24 family metallopeptidase [Nanoarchaeota archaeon]MCG2717353.1 M24 family metallopeptidase [Nanoarchaeota archaeon]